VTAQFSAEQILEVTGGRLAQGVLPDRVGAISADTRQLSEGDWYLALPGERFDGHDFLGEAFSCGAIGCIVAERPSYPIASTAFPLIAVGDTVAAYQHLARSWRERIDPLVVAVTGSSGKTTTKEMTACVLAAGLKTYKSEANYNNEIGVPKTILSMPEDTQALVLEMAMRGLGQIAVLARTGLPDIGIIVNAGVAHLELLGSVENVIRAKCELLENMTGPQAVAIIGRPSEPLMTRVSQVFTGKTLSFDPDLLRELEVTPDCTVFELLDRSLAAGKVCRFQVSSHGISMLQDAWCAIMAGREAGLDDQAIARGLKEFRPVGGRGNRLAAGNGAVVVDEAYNANPDSVRASVIAFDDARVFPQSRKFVVLGELAELGEHTFRLHRELGIWLKERKLSGLITVGKLARHIADGAQGAGFEVLACQDAGEAEACLRERLTSDSCVLIKGSHSANLDRLVSRLVSTAN